MKRIRKGVLCKEYSLEEINLLACFHQDFGFLEVLFNCEYLAMWKIG